MERLATNQQKNTYYRIDVAKKKHVARAIDDRGRDLAKRLVFENTFTGFKQLLKWAQNLADETNKSNFIFGMEPTGHYWLNLAYYLRAQELHAVVVNPMKVKRTKELDDDSPTKNDTKECESYRSGNESCRYHEPILLEGI
ncbi:IS110 family transposase [Lentibacillus sp. CBA3610]|uniref:IS110 family transposase n=1 Tax=Lentibacillus sp. CBA3610 TaxID=2518176 RepID=UPI0020D20C2C|nr:IS110 family transposase [Lentibacillus sp. CBA3610]